MGHRGHVGPTWERAGIAQVEFFVEKKGLLPTNSFLDIGCGCLRFGHLIIPYLDAGMYCGMEIDAQILAAGIQHELSEGAEAKKPHLACDGDFTFSRFDRTFDYACAHSLFIHLPLVEIEKCFANLLPVMAIGGKFFFTNIDGDESGVKRVVYPHAVSHSCESITSVAKGWDVEWDVGKGHPPTEHTWCLARPKT